MLTRKPIIKVSACKEAIFACLVVTACAVALVLAVASFPLPSARALALAQVGCHPPTWCVVTSPNPALDNNELDGIAAISYNDIWAVGTDGHPDLISRSAIAEHFDGTGWTANNPTKKGYDSNGLAAVAAVSSNSVWAVGSYYNGSAQYPLIQHYSNGSWQDVSGTIAYNATCGGSALAGVAALSDTNVWAVGAYNIGDYPCDGNGNPTTGPKVNHPYAQHCDLSVPTCTLVLPPYQGLWYNNMNGIAAISSTNMWAVGSYSTDVITNSPNYPRPLIWTYTQTVTGTNWITVASPTIGYDSWLNSVDYYNSSDIWAVGVQQSGLNYQPIIEHYDGSSWKLATGTLGAPYSGYNVTLNHVFVTSERDVWAVGQFDNGSASYPYIMRWVGYSNNDINFNRWQEPAGTSADTYNTLMGVAAVPGQVPITHTWAVGSNGHRAIGEKTLVENIAAPPAPISTTSYYETSTDPASHYQQGCKAALQNGNGTVVLDYGQPKDWGVSSLHSRYGTQLIGTGATAYITNSSTTTPNDITTAATKFALGYHDCYGSNQATKVIIAIGTSNNNKDNTAEISAAHAQAWANMISNVITNTSSYTMVRVAGAMDIEPDFAYTGTGHSADYDFSKVLTWTTTFSNDAGGAVYYNYGSTDAYPCTPPNPPLPANLGCSIWSADQLYSVSWGIPKAYPLPEIYKPLYSSYWYQLKRYGLAAYGSAMYFRGEMTECQSSGCTAPNDYSADQGYQTFWLKLNADPLTSESILWSTDIKCSNNSANPGCAP